MTDKDIKDYCKNCDVEPPAMRFKCPECKHNPDKEQIIIDGVNIIGTIDEWARLVAHEWGTDEYSDAEIVKNYILDINKQLARKSQELEVICKAFDIEYAYDDDGKIYGRSNKLRSLEQECEKLNKLVEQAKDAPICFQCEQEACIRQKKEKFKKALEEIEQELKEDIYCESQECGCDDFEECLRCTKEQILDIISRAKGS